MGGRCEQQLLVAATGPSYCVMWQKDVGVAWLCMAVCKCEDCVLVTWQKHL